MTLLQEITFCDNNVFMHSEYNGCSLSCLLMMLVGESCASENKYIIDLHCIKLHAV